MLWTGGSAIPANCVGVHAVTFQPVVLSGGLPGWAFLNRTLESQKAAFDSSASVQRDVDYLKENLPKADTAEKLISDPRLFRIALSAFGLEADAGNTFFMKKVLEEGTFDPESLANRLSDKRYFEMSKAFGYGDVSPPFTAVSTFVDQVARSFLDQRFEVGVGQADQSMRLALGFERELDRLLSRTSNDDALWYSVMATPPLRQVFEGALRLPSSVGTLDVDRQLALFKNRADTYFGASGVSQFADPEMREALITSFLSQSQLATGPAATTRGSVALALLQSAPSPYLGLI
jgi:hypothetical protein